MRYRDMRWAACGVAVLGAFGLTEAAASDWAARDTLPVHYSGLLNDHTPSAAVVKGVMQASIEAEKLRAGT